MISFVLFFISVGVVRGQVSELIFMKIHYTEKLIDGYIKLEAKINSQHECVEYCRDFCQCKSVGFDTRTMDCYLYDGRVYAGLPGTVNTNMIYYWQLEAECPILFGFSEDPISKICSKYNSTGDTWKEAQDQCQTENGILMSVDTPEKTYLLNESVSNMDPCHSFKQENVCNTSIKLHPHLIQYVLKLDLKQNFSEVLDTNKTTFPSLLKDLGTKLFLGATDIAEENVWNWFNGITIDRSKFMLGQPNNKNQVQHCLIYKYDTPSGFDDTECNSFRYPFICEVPTKKAYNT